MTHVALQLGDLNDGEVICSHCKGTRKEYPSPITRKCSKCFGEGKLDWIENIIGKHIIPCISCGGTGNDKLKRFGSMSWVASCRDCGGIGKMSF